MSVLVSAADFVAPAEGPVAFRRDMVPLDAETQANLSRQLGLLAAGLDTSTGAARRTAAQMLALATALDPANTAARELIASLQGGTHQPNANPEETAKFQARIWQYIGWLETPDAGDQGRALAACLADVIALSDPDHPRAEAILAAGERGAWAGWVPPVSAYETKAVAKDEPLPDPVKPEAKAAQITLTKAEVRTPMWQRVMKEIPNEPGNHAPPQWALSSAPLRMNARKAHEDSEEFSVVFRTAEDGGSLQQLGITIRNLLKKQHGELPAGWEIVISSEELQKSLLSGKRQSVSAAAAVLASAAITGREPDATIIGIIDEQGAFKVSSGFWDQLVSLGKGNGGRLVLPTAAAEYLPSVLALEKAQFFLDYEVVLAADFQDLLRLSAKTQDESTARATVKFQEIRSKSGSQPIGQYVANTFIRRRLAELAQEAPYHFSARMLAIQGAGNRPTQLPHSVLVPEMRRAIAPVEWLVMQPERFPGQIQNAIIERIAQTYESCRSQIDGLDRYVTKEDRELFLRVKEMVAIIRTLERAVRSRGEQDVIMESVTSARELLVENYKGIADSLGETTGEHDGVTNPTP